MPLLSDMRSKRQSIQIDFANLHLFDSLSSACSRISPLNRVKAQDAMLSPVSDVSSEDSTTQSFTSMSSDETEPSTPALSSGSDSSSFDDLMPRLSKRAQRRGACFNLPPRSSSLDSKDSPIVYEEDILCAPALSMSFVRRSGESYRTALEEPSSPRRISPPSFELQANESIYSLDSRERVRHYEAQLSSLSKVNPAVWWLSQDKEEEAVIGVARLGQRNQCRRIAVPRV